MVALVALLWANGHPACQCATSEPSAATPVSSLEDPSEAAAATTSQDLGSAAAALSGDEDICLRCYDKVKLAQEMIAVQTRLVERQKKLVHRKNKAAAAEAARLSRRFNNGNENPSSSDNLQESVNNNNNNNNNSGGPQERGSRVRSRTLQESEPVVISRLRVARAAPAIQQQQQQQVGGQGPKGNKLQTALSQKKDPDLKRLKQEQQQQLNATCRTLLHVQECLAELSRECIGNLQFHSLEVYSNQWHSKLSCPYRNNPALRVFPGLRSSYIQEETEGQPSKVPVPRRISSNEEVRSRLHEMFPNGFARPFGVMLKPTLTASASQRFAQMLEQHQQQQQQQEPNNKQQLRDFSGHFYHISANPHQQHPAANNQQTNNFFQLSRILLVPCCLALLVALVALTSLYYWL